MSLSNPSRKKTPTHDRATLLARLAEAVRSRGGTALVALSTTAHPVLYVRTPTRLVPVVVVQDATGNQWFIWGRTGSADTAKIEEAATQLCEPGRPPARSRINLVTARRATLRGAA